MSIFARQVWSVSPEEVFKKKKRCQEVSLTYFTKRSHRDFVEFCVFKKMICIDSMWVKTYKGNLWQQEELLHPSWKNKKQKKNPDTFCSVNSIPSGLSCQTNVQVRRIRRYRQRCRMQIKCKWMKVRGRGWNKKKKERERKKRDKALWVF